jgi:hypothetical protein
VHPGETLLISTHLRVRDVRRARREIHGGSRLACLTAEAPVTDALGPALIVLGADAQVEFDLADSPQVPLLELVETVYAALAGSSPAPRELARLLGGDPAVDCFFKRVLFLDLARFMSLAVLASRPELDRYARIVVDRRWPGSEVFPALLALWRRDRFSEAGRDFPAVVAGAIDRLELERPSRVRRLLSAGRAAAGLWLRLLRQIRPFARRPAPAPMIVHTYASDFGIDLGGLPRLRNVDFVVDGERISPADVVFWAELGQPQERIGALTERGYRVVTRRDVPLPANKFARSTLPSLLRLTWLLWRLGRGERWWLRPVANAGAAYLLWEHVVRALAPRAFLIVNDLIPTGAIRNLALRHGGCTTIQYQHSCHWRPGAAGWIRDYVFAFALIDAVATWGPAHSDHVLSHRGSIGATWEVGCLWSEHARLCADDPVLSARYRALLEEQAGRRLDDFERRVSVFDTSVSLLDQRDLASFHDGIARLARRLPHVLFLSKPKNADDESVPRRDGWPANLVLLPNLFETAAVIGLTELSISACFTSTAVEGMGCGRPTLYYDPTERFPAAFWRRIPDLVCTTDDELHERVTELLWQTTREEHVAYLRANCSALEGRFDGGALTRLRERLTATLAA